MVMQAWGRCAPLPRELCLCQIKKYEKLDSEEERAARSRHIFDHYIMKELLACSHVSAMLCRHYSGVRYRGGVPRAGERDIPVCLGGLVPSVFRGSSKSTIDSVLGATDPALWMGGPP